LKTGGSTSGAERGRQEPRGEQKQEIGSDAPEHPTVSEEVPAGTPGMGEITSVGNKGMWGKD
jgi:hypothetical protein